MSEPPILGAGLGPPPLPTDAEVIEALRAEVTRLQQEREGLEAQLAAPTEAEIVTAWESLDDAVHAVARAEVDAAHDLATVGEKAARREAWFDYNARREHLRALLFSLPAPEEPQP